MDKEYHFEFKIIVIGKRGVGKSTFISKLCKLGIKNIKKSISNE